MRRSTTSTVTARSRRSARSTGRTRSTSISAIVIAGSLVGAVAIPGLIVSPTATTAPGNKLGLAFGITMVGILIAVLTGIFQYRRTGNWVWYLVAATPAFAVFCGGAIFAATKAVAYRHLTRRSTARSPRLPAVVGAGP